MAHPLLRRGTLVATLSAFELSAENIAASSETGGGSRRGDVPGIATGKGAPIGRVYMILMTSGATG